MKNASTSTNSAAPVAPATVTLKTPALAPAPTPSSAPSTFDAKLDDAIKSAKHQVASGHNLLQQVGSNKGQPSNMDVDKDRKKRSVGERDSTANDDPPLDFNVVFRRLPPEVCKEILRYPEEQRNGVLHQYLADQLATIPESEQADVLQQATSVEQFEVLLYYLGKKPAANAASEENIEEAMSKNT